MFPLKSPSPQSNTYIPSLSNDCLLMFSHKYLCSVFQKLLLVFGVIVDNISGLPPCNLMLVVRIYKFRAPASTHSRRQWDGEVLVKVGQGHSRELSCPMRLFGLLQRTSGHLSVACRQCNLHGADFSEAWGFLLLLKLADNLFFYFYINILPFWSQCIIDFLGPCGFSRLAGHIFSFFWLT